MARLSAPVTGPEPPPSLSHSLAPCAHREFEVGAMRQELAALLDLSAPQGWPPPAEDCRDPGQAGHGKPAPLPVPLSRPGGPRESSGTSSPAGCLSLWQHQAEASVWRPQALWVLAVSVNGAGIGLGGAPRPHGVRTPAPVTGSGCPQLGALPIRRLSLVSEPNDKTGKQPSGQQSHPDLRLPAESRLVRGAPPPHAAWPAPHSPSIGLGN